MPNATLTKTLSVGGVNIAMRITRSGAGQLSQSGALTGNAAQAGILTTREVGAGGDDHGVVTLAEGHGVQTGDKVSVVWAGGYRLAMDATEAGNAVTVDGGDGDVLPAESTPITCCQKMARFEQPFNGDLLKMIASTCTKECVAGYYDSGDGLLVRNRLLAGEGTSWEYAAGQENPFAGKVVSYILVGLAGTQNASFQLAGVADSQT